MSASSYTAASQRDIKIISSSPYGVAEYFKKLKRYGFLISVLAKRELKIKYAKTWLGLGWLFVQPLALVVIYSVFFKSLIRIDTGSVPYPSFVFSGLLLWYIFTGIVAKCSHAIPESAELIHKVSFPKIIILVAKILPVLLEAAALLFLFIMLLIVTRQPLGLNALTVLFYISLVSIFSFALGLFCSVLVVKFRDIVHLVPFVLNFAIWLTPVFYPVALIPAAYQDYLLMFNPVARAIDGLRKALFSNSGISPESWITLGVSLIFLLFSFYYFIKFEKTIVEKL